MKKVMFKEENNLEVPCTKRALKTLTKPRIMFDTNLA